MTPKILIVLTSHNKIEKLNKPTGWFLPELAHPYYQLAPHFDIVTASPAGGEAPLDPQSIELSKDDGEAQKFLREEEHHWKKTEKLETFTGRAKEFDAIFFVGGHGPMFDLAVSPVSQQIVREFYEASNIVAAVCHGPAALVNVKLSTGAYLIAGQKTTGFTNAEEIAFGTAGGMPFELETELKKHSGKDALFVGGEDWAPNVVVSGEHGRLITGQNPASAREVGQTILKAVSA